MERQSKGMDITEYVKRNNFAVAQYEPKPCRNAQKRLLSKGTSRLRSASLNASQPQSRSSNHCLRRESRISVHRVVPIRRIGAPTEELPHGGLADMALVTWLGRDAAANCFTLHRITYFMIRNIFDGQSH